MQYPRSKSPYQFTAGHRAPQTRLLSIVMLVNLVLGSGFLWIPTANAAPVDDSSSSELVKKDKKERRNENRQNNENRENDNDDDRDERGEGDNRLSPSRVNILRRDLARRLGIDPGKVKAVETRRETWPNRCLGLPRSGESCGEARVQGWRVVLSANGKNWVYRTDRRVENYRLETEISTNPGGDSNQGGELPRAIASRVLQAAANQLRVDVSSLRIVQAERQTWPNGCLGIAEPDTLCTQALVPGWRVVVSGRERRLVYRTNESGSVIKLDRAASRL